MRFHGAIEKTYKDDQGHLIVCGHASTEALDSQGEIVTKEAMGAALTDYMKFANVREMHQPSAVGKTLLAEQDEKGTYIEVKVVDPVAAMKCEEGVYSGFSIGGKASTRDGVSKNIITGLRLTEISLVDRPANPEAVFTMFKLDDTLEEDETPVAPIKKGMYHVGDLACLLHQLGYLVDDQVREAAREGDGSLVPARLQAWLVTGAGILTSMTEEETAELVAASAADLLANPVMEPPMAMAEATEGLEKKGAKFSQATYDQLIGFHNTLQENLGQLHSLLFPDVTTDLHPDESNLVANPNVYAQPEGERGEAGTPIGNVDTSANGALSAPLPNAPGIHDSGAAGGKAEVPEDIQKAHDETLAKVASLTSDLEKANSDKETLAKRVAELEAEPAPSKVRLLQISKAQDVVVSGETLSKAEALAKCNDPVDVMKAVHMTGAQRGYPQR